MTGRIPRFIYLGRPIDQQGDEEIAPHPWYDSYQQFRRAAELAGYGLYDPSRAWTVGSLDLGDEVQHVNRLALHRCDAAAFWLPAGEPSIGVPVEIDRSLSAGKPTIIFTNVASWFLSGDLEFKMGDRGLRMDLTQGGVGRALDWLDGHRVPPFSLRDQPEPMRVQPQTLRGVRGESRGELPSKAYPEDAGFDLTVSCDTVLEPGQFTDVPTDLAIELPGSYWGMIIGRSSTLRTRKIVVAPGVIDNGWRGPIYAGCIQYEDHPILVKAGERLAQLILLPTARHVQPQWANELSPSPRGTNGFGSSGE